MDARIKSGDKKDDAILKELQHFTKESKAIRFEGNGYGDEWVKEAKKRGLSNLKDTPTALEVWGRKEVAELFSSLRCADSRGAARSPRGGVRELHHEAPN